MIVRAFEKLPPSLQTAEVRPYYEALQKKKGSLFVKRCFDIFVSLLLLVLLSPVLLFLAIAIRIDSPGPILFRQVRITQYGRSFRIWKFRTMVKDAEKLGAQVTTDGDRRITRMGKLLRKCRLDELPQLFNILSGKMTFVGTRPEVPRYVERYSGSMWATLLLPAGVTSQASIAYKDEDRLLSGEGNVDDIYVEQVLPEKMKYNLEYLLQFSFMRDLKLMWQTVWAVLH